MEEGRGGECAFCGERGGQKSGGGRMTTSEAVRHLMGECGFFECERAQWMKTTAKVWQSKVLGTERGADLVEKMAMLARAKIKELKWNPRARLAKANQS